MHPYLVDALAAEHRADLRREAEAQHRTAGVRRPLTDRLRTLVEGGAVPAFRPARGGAPVCCPA